MESFRALVVDADRCVANKLIASTLVSFQIDRAASFAEFRKAADKRMHDVFLLHETAKMTGIQFLAEINKLHASVPTIVLASAASGIWQATLGNSSVEVLSADANERELEYRIAKMIRRPAELRNPPEKTRAAIIPIPELRNDSSGRLDAKRIAPAFGISLSDLSRSIGKKLQAVHQTPDAQSLQKSLFAFERIASALLKLTGSSKGLKIWLNSPNNAFPGELPIDVLKQGNAELVAGMLEDALLGHSS